MSDAVTPFILKDAPALIERLLPVQKLCAEAYKEQMAGSSKTLTALGTYWKGRKPLILNKACILGCLLPATDDPVRDLEVFEMLMGMDNASLEKRLEDKNNKESRFILNQQRSVGYDAPYKVWIQAASRAEECGDELFDHIWDTINAYLGTNASSFQKLIEQLGIMRFGHRPRLADTFCGSGQIPFEAALLGCDVYASDLNPVACMLTWGAFNIIGGTQETREKLAKEQQDLISQVKKEINTFDLDEDDTGWHAKVYLYCVEVRCPQTGWMVPLLPSLIVSKGYRVIAELVPDFTHKRYNIKISSGVNDEKLSLAERGTMRSDGRGKDPYMIHTLGGIEYRTKISTMRGDYRKSDGSNNNQLRTWDKADYRPRPEDVFQERLYCVQWKRLKKGKREEYEFRSVTSEDLRRENIAEKFIDKNLADWQSKGWVPDMHIEPGDKTDELIRTRGWTYWHHLWNPRQLIALGIIRKQVKDEALAVIFAGILDYSSKLGRWATSGARISKDDSQKRIGGASNSTSNVFDNQALNPLYNYGLRSAGDLLNVINKKIKHFPITSHTQVACINASDFRINSDIFITDPPYGDAVKYEEILEFFIAWMRKNPPPQFADWVWDSRRSLAIKGEGEDFRRGMVAAYRRMTECMPDNGIQVIMFTHQSGSIWADMANIVWASGLCVTAAWYVATETDSAMRQGSYVKGTVLLICRKRGGGKKTTHDDLAWEIMEEVEAQVRALTGLNQEAKGFYRDENVFEDADIQIAGYAAALRVLTRYATIDGRDMVLEATRPRVNGETTFVDSLIAFAVDTANQYLVPQGISKIYWDKLNGGERFYLKLLDLETRGNKALDNYQNFAKAFKVRDFHALMGDQRANHARLKSAVEFGRAEMNEGSELYQSVLRAVLYAVMELVNNVDGAEVLAHLMLNVPDYYADMTQREIAIELAAYLARQLETLRPEEASATRVLRELVKNQRLG